ncbi:MAG: choice-of-anchor tandem repeat GloVer-containing protein, partial [Verrucomicrobiota bacterium]
MSLMPVRIVAVLATLFSSSLWAQTFELLYAFPKDRSDGRRPTASLTAGPGGYLYGTTTEGGTHDAGTVFRVSTGGQVEILNDFEENTTGRLPYGRLLNIGDGSLYGVSERNGNVAGNPSGTVYRLDEQGGLTALFQFPSGGNSPRKPRALTSGEANTLHVACFDPAGLWRVPLDGAAPSVARLFGSTVTDGIFITSLIRGSDGLFYGTTQAGGAKSLGTIFRIAPDGTGLTQLYSG